MRLTEIRTALDELQLRPTKSLGQNFLHDQNLARAIAAAAVSETVPFAVEIGPGLGALTAPLLERCNRLLLIEKDARLVAWLRVKFPADRVEVIHADACDFDWRPLMRHGAFPLAGNLPYCATSPILRHWLGACSPVSHAAFAVQDEFAVRLAARPGSADYSALTVRTQRLWNVIRKRALPPSVFFPEPGVDSALVVLNRREPTSFSPVRTAFFDDLVQRGFSQRRKQLKPLLKTDSQPWASWCGSQGLPATCRAENLSVSQWADLAHTLDPAAQPAPQNDDEMFDVVDENNNVIGIKSRGVVHKNNLLHRAAHILVFNRDGDLLLQKRSAWKDREPLKWDTSAAGHLAPGESYANGALREVREELGIHCSLKPMGKINACPETGHEFIEIFSACHNGPFVLPPAEIEGVMFFPPPVIAEWLTARPQDFAPGFRAVWKVLQEAGHLPSGSATSGSPPPFPPLPPIKQH